MKRQQVKQTISSVRLIDCNSLPYSPALLLDAHLSAAITDHPQFPHGCRLGFEFCCEVIREHIAESNFPYSRSQMIDFVWDNLFDEGGKRVVSCLSYRVGYVLGGLSAIALSQYQDAQEGLEELMTLVTRFESR